MNQQEPSHQRVNEGLKAFEPFIDKQEIGRRTQARPRTVDDWMKRGLLPEVPA